MGQVRRTIRWRVLVSADTDQSLRTFLACQGSGRKGELSRFIEAAVQSHILALTAAQAKLANEKINEADLNAKVDEALQWARKH